MHWSSLNPELDGNPKSRIFKPKRPHVLLGSAATLQRIPGKAWLHAVSSRLHHPVVATCVAR